MAYCTASEVKAAINFPSTGAPVSDSDIEAFILQSEEEIENIYKTKFGNVEIDSTATSGDTTTITDTTAEYLVDQYIGFVVWIYGGTNVGEYREITSNTTTALTVSPAFSAAIDNTSTFRITKLGYKDQTLDGTGTDTQFVEFQPLINLNALTIDSISITTSNVFKYKASGKLLLSVDAETRRFTDATPQLINLKYVFGVYPLPRPVKRLCIILSGIRTLAAQTAGTYDDFTNVSLPGGLTASKGEPFTNIQSAITSLQGEARGIIYGFEGDQVTADFRNIPSYIPFTMFG